LVCTERMTTIRIRHSSGESMMRAAERARAWETVFLGI
jgi:hypothetical protein